VHAATVDVQILATNDFHGRLQLRGPENRDRDAGAAVLAGAVKSLRTPTTVFAAAGDLIGASTFESFISKDKPTIDALNEAGLEVSAAGNHEFDQGYNDLVNRVMAPYDATTNPYGGANWQYLAANVRKKADNSPALPDRWIRDFGSVEVGFVGAVTEDLPSLVSPAGISDLKVTSIIEEANASADALEAEGADVIVLLVHEGAPDTTFASATSNDNAFGRIVNGVDSNIDAIVSGHTHLAYNHAVPVPAWAGRPVTTRPVVSAGQYGQKLNQLTFSVDDVTGTVTAKSQNVLDLTAADPDGDGPGIIEPNYPADPATTAIVNKAFADAEAPGSVVLGKLGGPFRRARLANGTTENRGGESTLGNLVAEVQRWATASPQVGGAQIAFMNPGGLRQDMTGVPGGYPANLTYKQAAVVQPFANTLVNMKLTGAQIKTLLEQQWQRDSKGDVPTRPFQRLGTSKGFFSTFDATRPEGDRITGIWLNGKPIEPATSYSVTVNSFLASGGDNFRVLTQGTNKRDTGKVDLQAMVDYMAEAAKTGGVPVDYAQHQVGVTWPADKPRFYRIGQDVELRLSSLAMTGVGDFKDTKLDVKVGDKTLNPTPVDNTGGTEQFDNYGVSAVDVKLKGKTKTGKQLLTFTGATTGTTFSLPIDVRKAKGILKVRTKPERIVKGETRTRLKIKASALGISDVTGKIVVKAGGKKYTVKLKDGKAFVRLDAFGKRGAKRVVVKYAGSRKVRSTTQVVKIRVRGS
jgi:5'-nucleotidase